MSIRRTTEYESVMNWLRNARKIDEDGLEADASGKCAKAWERLQDSDMKPVLANEIEPRDYVVVFPDAHTDASHDYLPCADFYAYSSRASYRRAIHIAAEDGMPMCDARKRDDIPKWLRKNADVARRIDKPLCEDCKAAVGDKTRKTVERILKI